MKALLEKLGIQDVNPGACTGPDSWIEDPDGKPLVSFNPTTGEPLAIVTQAPGETCQQVIAEANNAFLTWRGVPAPKRGEIVRDLGNALRMVKEPLGELVSLEMGKIRADVRLRDALLEMTDKGLGMTAIVDDDRRILGIYTDGDLRRTLDAGADIRETIIRDVMHTNCKTVGEDILAAEALHMLEQNKITGLLVADDDGLLIGALNIHDLFREGLM